MRYYLDTEYDGHNGPLMTMALISEDKSKDIYIVTPHIPTDPWVIENVVPLIDNHKAKKLINTTIDGVGVFLRDFLLLDDMVEIVADSLTDIGHFARAYSTRVSGEYCVNYKTRITFVVENVESYPTKVEGALQHNSYWDALALLNKMTSHRLDL